VWTCGLWAHVYIGNVFIGGNTKKPDQSPFLWSFSHPPLILVILLKQRNWLIYAEYGKPSVTMELKGNKNPVNNLITSAFSIHLFLPHGIERK